MSFFVLVCLNSFLVLSVVVQQSLPNFGTAMEQRLDYIDSGTVAIAECRSWCDQRRGIDGQLHSNKERQGG